MNSLIIIIAAYACLSSPMENKTDINNPLNHVVSYESPRTMGPMSKEKTQDCFKNIYFFSNHTESNIEVEFQLTDKQSSEVQTIILKPLLLDKEGDGGQRRITRPEKIGGSCDITYKILNAKYVH